MTETHNLSNADCHVIATGLMINKTNIYYLRKKYSNQRPTWKFFTTLLLLTLLIFERKGRNRSWERKMDGACFYTLFKVIQSWLKIKETSTNIRFLFQLKILWFSCRGPNTFEDPGPSELLYPILVESPLWSMSFFSKSCFLNSIYLLYIYIDLLNSQY